MFKVNSRSLHYPHVYQSGVIYYCLSVHTTRVKCVNCARTVTPHHTDTCSVRDLLADVALCMNFHIAFAKSLPLRGY